MATRCCSPPESWCGKNLYLEERPTIFNIWEQTSRIVRLDLRSLSGQMLHSHRRSGSFKSRKSWNTTRGVGGISGTYLRGIFLRSMSLTTTGRKSAPASFKRILINVDFPEPLRPIMKTNSPSSMVMFTFPCFRTLS